MAYYGDVNSSSAGGQRRWVRQAVMGVLRWRDSSSAAGATATSRHSIGNTREVNFHFSFVHFFSFFALPQRTNTFKDATHMVYCEIL